MNFAVEYCKWHYLCVGALPDSLKLCSIRHFWILIDNNYMSCRDNTESSVLASCAGTATEVFPFFLCNSSATIFKYRMTV